MFTPNETHGEETCMTFSSLDSAGTLPIKNSEGGPQMGPPPAESLTPSRVSPTTLDRRQDDEAIAPTLLQL